MLKSTIGSVLLWAGDFSFFAASCLAIWWIQPVWRNVPAAEFAGTVWVFGGPIYRTIALSVPIGFAFALIGVALSLPLTKVGLPYMVGGLPGACCALGKQGPQMSDPTIVSDPVQWRSSATAQYQVTIMEPKRRNTQ